MEGASGALAAPDPFADGEIFTCNDSSFSLGAICNRCMARPVREHSMQRCNSCITALLHMGFDVISTEDQQGQGLDLQWGLPSRLRGGCAVGAGRGVNLLAADACPRGPLPLPYTISKPSCKPWQCEGIFPAERSWGDIPQAWLAGVHAVWCVRSQTLLLKGTSGPYVSMPATLLRAAHLIQFGQVWLLLPGVVLRAARLQRREVCITQGRTAGACFYVGSLCSRQLAWWCCWSPATSTS